MQTQVTLICVSSDNKKAFYQLPNDPCREGELRKDSDGRLYFQLNITKHYLPKEFQPRLN